MGINKVNYGNTTLIDISNDTVTADKLAQGYTAHDNTGAAITGTAIVPSYAVKTVTPTDTAQIITPNGDEDVVLSDVSLTNSAGSTATTAVSLSITFGQTYHIKGKARCRRSVTTTTLTFDAEWECGTELPYIETADEDYPSILHNPTITLNSSQLSLYNDASVTLFMDCLVISELDATYDGLSAVVVNAMSGANILVRDSADYTNSTQLQYNNIPAEPKAFAVIYNTNSSSRISTTSYYVTAVVYDGEETTMTASRRQSSYLYLVSGSESFTYSGTNHHLLVKTNQTFHTSSDYKLVYIY